MKKIIALVMALFMVTAFAACGGEEETLVGKYKIVSVSDSVAGTMTEEQISSWTPDGVGLEIIDGSHLRIYIASGVACEGTYTLNGSKMDISIEYYGIGLVAEIEGDKITVTNGKSAAAVSDISAEEAPDNLTTIVYQKIK